MGEIALRFLCYCRADVDDTPPSGRAHVRNDGTSQRREGYGEDLKDTPEVLIGQAEEISSGEVIGLRHYDFGRPEGGADALHRARSSNSRGTIAGYPNRHSAAPPTSLPRLAQPLLLARPPTHAPTLRPQDRRSAATHPPPPPPPQ